MQRWLKITGAIVVVAALSVVAVGVAAATRASAIGASTLDAARREISGTGKVVVVSFCQKGCLPCQMMKVTTWKDGAVVRWMSEHGIGVQVDTDAEPSIARELRADATPMVIMLAERGEIARKRGYMPAGEMAEWLESSFEKRSR